MTAIFGASFGVGPMELLIVTVVFTLLVGWRFPPFGYWVDRGIAAIPQQFDRPDNTRWRRTVFFCLLAVIGLLALLMLLDR